MKNASKSFEDEGLVATLFTGYKISQKHFNYNDTHKTSFIMVELMIAAEFIDGKF